MVLAGVRDDRCAMVLIVIADFMAKKLPNLCRWANQPHHIHNFCDISVITLESKSTKLNGVSDWRTKFHHPNLNNTVKMQRFYCARRDLVTIATKCTSSLRIAQLL